MLLSEEESTTGGGRAVMSSTGLVALAFPLEKDSGEEEPFLLEKDGNNDRLVDEVCDWSEGVDLFFFFSSFGRGFGCLGGGTAQLTYMDGGDRGRGAPRDPRDIEDVEDFEEDAAIEAMLAERLSGGSKAAGRRSGK